MKCPCYNCQDRVIGCHARCAAYQAYSTFKFAESLERRRQIDNTVSRAKDWDKVWKKQK